MADIKIIFFDIDGTLLDPDTGRISEKTVETLLRLKENGIVRCVVTGRAPCSLPDLSALQLDAVSTFNGSLCCSGTQVIHSNPIAPADVQAILRNAAALNRPVSIALRDRLAANGLEQDLADYYRNAGLELTVAEDFEEACREDVYQIMLGCRDADQPAILRGVSNAKIAVSWERAADVIPLSGGKGSAVRQICQYYGLDVSQAMAFGDQFNDLEMLQAVGTGVAMGNGADALKAIADDVCAPVSQDGIYQYCRSLGLI